MERYNQQREDMNRKLGGQGQGDDTGPMGHGRGDLDYTHGTGFGGEEGDSRLELNDLHEEMARMNLAGYGINNGSRVGTRTPPQTPMGSSKGSVSSLNASLSESSIVTPRGTGTRTGYNQKLDSHSRLFGAPDQKDAYRKPNHMKSDIFGIGFGSGDYQQKRMTSPKPVTENAEKPAPHAGGGDYFEYQKTTPTRRSSEGTKSSLSPFVPAGAPSDMPTTSNARENGGNPVTGTGYQPDGRAHRRRQFTKTQFAPTGFW